MIFIVSLLVLFVVCSYVFKRRYSLTWYEAFCETIDWITRTR